MKTFTAQNKTYSADAETYALLEQFNEAGNSECFLAVFTLGLASGRIVEAA